MGTTFTLQFYAESDQAANTAAEAAFARIGVLNSLLSDYDEESELSRLSAGSPHAAPVPVSDELWTVLSHAQRLSRDTGGAFDVTVGPIVRLWRRARRQNELPDEKRLEQALNAFGFEHIVLDEQNQAVQLLREGMRLDLGSIAKGYAADEALRELKRHGITQALIDAGGDLVAGDPPPEEFSWRIEIARPNSNDSPRESITAQPDEPLVVFVANAAVAQSGDAYQYVEIGGKRYSHIVDPKTGLGLTNRIAVTVIAPDGISADSLASAVSVLGREKGLEFVEKHDETEALIQHVADDEQLIKAKSSGWASFTHQKNVNGPRNGDRAIQ